MEGTNIEKQRFEKKANGYSSALKLVPYARNFEIIPILNILNDFVNKSGLSKNDVKIVELMAGSGFLTNHLIKAGYKNLDIFEVSPDMVDKIIIKKERKNINIHQVSDITQIEDVLKQIQPNIIISLAGYHHLIDYNDNQTINIENSIKYQKKVTDICISSVSEKHLVLIVDIFDDKILTAQPAVNLWKIDKKTKSLIPNNLIPKDISSNIYNIKNISNYSTLLAENFINPASSKNSAIKWFRNVIDKHSTAGHKDVAISKNFIKSLENDYLVRHSSVYTPWIFKDKEQLHDYIKTFWFLDLSAEKLKKIYELIKNMNLSRTIDNGTTFFNWELTYLTIQKKDINLKGSLINKGITYLIVLIVLLLFGIIIKKYTFYYKFAIIIDKFIWVNIALFFKEVIYPKLKHCCQQSV